jgi:hypothetical protein
MCSSTNPVVGSLFFIFTLSAYGLGASNTSQEKAAHRVSSSNFPSVAGVHYQVGSVSCFEPKLSVKSDAKKVKVGETVSLSTPGVKKGQGYGRVQYEWSSSDGKIFIVDGQYAWLSTRHVPPNTKIEVSVTARSEVGNCVARGTARIQTRRADGPVILNQPPTVALEVGSVTAVATNVVRASASTVCVGDTVALAARASDPDGDTLLYRWTTSGGRITGEGANVTFDSTGLAPGDYTVTVEVDDKYGGVAFDSKTVRVENCPPNIITPNPYLDVSPASSTVNAGEAVNFSTSGVSGGQNYGNVTYNWTTSAGTIQGSGLSARLDTTGVAPGMIRIEVRATIEALNWWVGSGSAAVTVVVYHSRPPEARRLSTCNDFSRGRPIVPGTCQAHLDQAVQQLQTEQSAELWVWVFHSENEQNTLGYDRARHVESYLADSIRRRQLDANRFRVTAFGTSTDGSQVVVWFIPALATRPDAPHAMTSPTDFGRPHRRQGQRQAQRDRVGQRAQARARRHHRRALRPGRPRERVPRR